MLSKHTTEVIDSDGVLLETKTTTKQIKISAEPNFVKLYLDDILHLTGLSSANSSILYALVERMDYENTVYLSGALRRNIAEKLEIAAITLTKALERLISQEIIYRQERGVYLINPHLIAKGKWTNVESIRLTVDYKAGKKTIKSNIKFDDE